MVVKNIVKKNTYYDSVTLMMISSKITSLEGILDATVMMGTDYNKKLMTDSGLLLPENADITSNDLVIAAKADSEERIEELVKVIEDELQKKNSDTHEGDLRAKTLNTAIKRLPGANFTIISVPGKHAKREAMKALENDIHVLLFSDNVSIEEEIELKDKAIEKGLLMMGPDCGTAIISGAALGFANVVNRGKIGMVAAAGTGLQEVTCLVSRFGEGVSQAIGTGGRDVKEYVGGRMMLMGIEALAQDEETEVIVIISKPPHKSVMEKIFKSIENIDKPVVTCFIGGSSIEIDKGTVIQTFTLEDAAHAAVSLARGEKIENIIFTSSKETIKEIVQRETRKLSENQKYIRGVYSGGTLSSEAMVLMNDYVEEIYSNTPLKENGLLKDIEKSEKNTVLDMGDDYFTNGRPHPMIDPRLRLERMKKEALDPETAVVLLDVVIGYGAHEDTAGTLIPTIEEINNELQKEGRSVSFIASVCGTDEDIQCRKDQIEKLEKGGVIVMPSNAQATRLALLISSKGEAWSKMMGGSVNE
ncbi:acyl-CoA synthetase FdrA [Clostridium sp. MSJ-11]|uniref:Acyl-CoA synthetase FdrA n=1 Tax=Clostridium mobile TaxID=2841512 RepID=A0ABS6EF24_9CLOT|nr:acyl-CoA synthetase FdrA [Clostridium mobile]MBU5483813.1 acyl-CoA synthetase FdrA [Clostridium mobile]